MAVVKHPARLLEVIRTVSSSTDEGRYFHWDDLRYRKPPEGISVEEWWLGLKMHRKSNSRSIPLTDTKGALFRFNVPDLVADLLHQIDRGGGLWLRSLSR